MILYNLYGRSVGTGGARGAKGARGASGAGGFLDVLKHFYDFLQQEIRQFIIYYARSLVRLSKRTTDQASDVPSIFFS